MQQDHDSTAKTCDNKMPMSNINSHHVAIPTPNEFVFPKVAPMPIVVSRATAPSSRLCNGWSPVSLAHSITSIK